MAVNLSTRLLAPAAVLSLLGCGGPLEEDLTVKTSALAVEVSTNPRAVADGTSLHSVYRRPGGGIDLTIGDPPSGATYYPVQVEATASPWIYIRRDGVTAILYVDTNGHVHEMAIGDSVGNYTTDTDFFNSLNAPIAKVGTANAPTPDVIGRVRMARGGPVDSIIYVGADNHIIEVMSNSTGAVTYSMMDITYGFTGVTVGAGSAFPHARGDGMDTIYYIASDNHIHELTSASSISWQDWDLYAASAETVSPRSDPSAYTRSDGVDSVVFEGSDSRIHELTLQNNWWAHWTLPSAYAVNGLRGRPSGYVRHDSVNAVVYVGTDINKRQIVVHEIALQPSGWVDSKLPLSAYETPQGQPFGLARPTSSAVFFRVTVKVSGGIYSYGRELILDSWGWTEYSYPP